MAIRTFIYPAPAISVAGVATEATLLLVEQNTADTVAELVDVNTELDTQTTALNDINAELNTQTTELNDINSELDAHTVLLTDIESNTSTANTELADINTELNSQTALLTSIDSNISNLESSLNLTPVDQLDTPLLDASVTNIPDSSSLPLEVVASTAAIVRKLVQVDDIGEFIGVYTGPASSEVLLAIMPLGGGEMEVSIPAATRISLRNMQNVAITSGLLSINFLG